MPELDVESTIRRYLGDVIHMSLGTARDGVPWVCEVHFAFDEGLDLYFVSLTGTRHSGEIRDNARVAGNVVVQHGPTDKPRGVYFEGRATQLEDVTADDAAYRTYKERFGARAEILDQQGDPDGRRFYRVEVGTFYLFDARESVPPRKYELPWKR